MAESVSILTTYCTVWYALIDRAQLTKSKYISITNSFDFRLTSNESKVNNRMNSMNHEIKVSIFV